MSCIIKGFLAIDRELLKSEALWFEHMSDFTSSGLLCSKVCGGEWLPPPWQPWWLMEESGIDKTWVLLYSTQTNNEFLMFTKQSPGATAFTK